MPADGFYEWQAQGNAKRKQPYRIVRQDGEPFAFAGLWEHWKPKQGQEGEPINTFTIIVTDANELVRPLHDRMPVILEPEDYELWLEGGPDATDEAERLLRPYPSEKLRAYPVSTRVNSPENDDAGCIEPLGEQSQ